MRRGRLYRHRLMTDVAAEILSAFYVRERGEWSVRLRWWNIGKCHRPWNMGIEQRLSLVGEDWIDITRSNTGRME